MSGPYGMTPCTLCDQWVDNLCSTCEWCKECYDHEDCEAD